VDVSGVMPGNVQATTMSGASRMGGPGSEDRMQGAMNSAAQLFGMTPQDLATAVDGGQSLSAIAAAKGVSQSDLLSAITNGIQQTSSQGSIGPTGPLADQIANRIAHHAGGRHHHHGAPSIGTAAATSATAGSAPAPSGATPSNGSTLNVLA